MRHDRGAAQLAHEPHGGGPVESAVGDVGGAVVAQVAVHGVLDAAAVAGVHERRRDVGPGDRPGGVGVDALTRDLGTEGGEAGEDQVDPLVSASAILGQRLGEPGRIRVGEQGDQVHGPPERRPGADLDARDDPHTVVGTRMNRLSDTVDGVVVGQGEGRDAVLDRERDHARRWQGPV